MAQGQARQLQGLPRGVLQHEHGLHQRDCGRGSRTGRSSSTRLVERQVLVGEGGERRASRARPSSWRKLGSPASRPRRTSRLTKKPISGSISGRLRLATAEPTSRSSWPRPAAEQGLEAGEEDHEEGRPLALGERGERGGERARQGEPQLAAAERCGALGAAGRPAAPGGRGAPASSRAPVRQLAGQELAASQLALPGGEVGVLDRQLRQRRLGAPLSTEAR